MRRARLATLLVAALATSVFASQSALDAAIDTTKYQEKVDTKDMVKTLKKLQHFADHADGTRTAGTEGHDESAEHMAKEAKKLGYDVTMQEFDFDFFQELATPEFEQVAPTPTTYVPDVDFITMEYSGSGDVTAPVQGVDLVLPPGPDPNTSTSGCEASDFAGFTPGNIALLQRGTCTFFAKATNAEAAGAVGAIIFNEGQPGRTATLAGTLGGVGVTIPTTGIGFDLGEELATTAGLVARLFTSTITEVRSTVNVLADSPWGNPDETIVVGAHLDSVSTGPGIQDNGSGSAMNLELAEELSKLFHMHGKNVGQGKDGYKGVTLQNRVRFAWWSAEESGLVGSQYYVDNLTLEEFDQIALNLNFDMVASPNFVRFIYNGDGDGDPDAAGPPGSDEIEALFNAHFDGMGLAHEPTAFDGRSDYGPFIDVGIPAGGLFTGAEGVKTAAQVATYGGMEGDQYDPCYHLACDDIDNITENGMIVLEQNGNAAADVLLQLLTTTDLPG
ncbi:MAG TPA: M28 family peptidase [Actinomycetota bacterium]